MPVSVSAVAEPPIVTPLPEVAESAPLLPGIDSVTVILLLPASTSETWMVVSLVGVSSVTEIDAGTDYSPARR